jgi:propanediol utilization protein
MNQSTHKQATNSMRVPVALSPSHAHLTSDVIQQLFCDNYRLHEASRVGLTQFAALESVSLIGPNGQTIDVPVIGPARKTDEVQLSQSDALKLGIDAPICTPGDHEDTPGILIKGPRTQVTLELGVIRALPHIHMGPEDAERLGVADRDRIEVISEPDPQRILFRNVPVLVSVDYRLELHLDADEGKAAGLASGDCVRLRQADAMRARSGKRQVIEKQAAAKSFSDCGDQRTFQSI